MWAESPTGGRQFRFRNQTPEGLSMNEKKKRSTAEAINSQAAELALMRMLLMALADQVPDKEMLISDFLQMSEDQEMRALYSTHPESFFASLQETRKTYLKVLRMS